MSKAEAYICDCCGELRHGVECVGVKPIEDMFNKLDSYPTIPRPEKADIHYCISCYNKLVVSVAEREINRKKDERGYAAKIKELSYLLKSNCVIAFNRKNMKKHLRDSK